MGFLAKIAQSKQVVASDPFGKGPQAERKRQVFIATFSLLAKLVSADGVISRDEKRAIGKFITEVLELDKARNEYAIQIFQQAKQSPVSFELFAQDYYSLFSNNERMCEWMLDTLYLVAMADGQCCGAEEQLIRKAGEIFKLPPATVERLRSMHIAGVTEPGNLAEADPATVKLCKYYQLLGCEVDATDDQLAACFRSLCDEHDPEKIIALGLPDDFVGFARKRLQAFEEAFNLICSQRIKEKTKELRA